MRICLIEFRKRLLLPPATGFKVIVESPIRQNLRTVISVYLSHPNLPVASVPFPHFHPMMARMRKFIIIKILYSRRH